MKLDLHTHCGEAFCCYSPTVDMVEQIVAAVQARGLDGIGITEHHNKAYGCKVKEIVDQYFSGKIVVIPGEEISSGSLHVVLLHLADDVTFRFIAHPGYPPVKDLASGVDETIHGIELRNPLHDDEMDERTIRRLAEEYHLLLLSNSDAHFLGDIGKYCTEIEVEELRVRGRHRATLKT